MDGVRKTYQFEAELLVTSHTKGKHRKKTRFQVTKPMAEWKLQEHQKIQQYLTMNKDGDDVQIIEIREVDEE